jgi:plastocyanin
MNALRLLPLPVFALALASCGGGEKPAPPTEAPPAAAAGPIQPCPTCKVHVVTMTTTDEGNFFTPKELEAHEGDVLRFTLSIGVHNVHFLPDSNPGVKNLPPASDLLQLPGQTHDILLNFGTGRFYFQCDPHAALGMTGHVKVESRDER